MPNVTPQGTSDKAGKAKPKKPRKKFPLGIHKGTGYWCKKVAGKVQYFGRVADDPEGTAALEKYLDLINERERKPDDGILLGDLCNDYLAVKEGRRDSGELSPRTFQGYYATCKAVCDHFGRGQEVATLTPDDFLKLRNKLAKKRGAVALGDAIVRVRMIFKFAYDQGKILTPMRFGQAFAKPSKRVVTKAKNAHQAEHGDRMFDRAELRQILAAAKPSLKAMTLLGCNCGFGQTDISSLPTKAIDLDNAWIDFPRVKTGAKRRCPLWPETVTAIREWQAVRPKAKAKADAGLLFITAHGKRWIKVNGTTGSHSDAVGLEFNKLLVKLGIKRSRVGFYALRHTFETIGGDSLDQVAVDYIMGHSDGTMASAYRERIEDARLQKVVDHVRSWLFAKEED